MLLSTPFLSTLFKLKPPFLRLQKNFRKSLLKTFHILKKATIFQINYIKNVYILSFYISNIISKNIFFQYITTQLNINKYII